MRNMISRKHTKKSHGKLEMTPMVDVIFQLLIFFLVATEFRPTEADFKTNLPGSGEGEMEKKEEEEPDPSRVDLTRVTKAETFEGQSYQIEGAEVKINQRRVLGTMWEKADPNARDQLTGTAFDELAGILAPLASDKNFMLVIDGSRKVRNKFVMGALDAAFKAGVVHITFGRLEERRN